MSAEQTVFLYDKIYIPKSLLPDQKLFKPWEFVLLGPKVAVECEHRKPGEENHRCIKCPNYLRTIKLWGEFSGKNGVSYYYFPLGAFGDIFRRLNLDPTTVTVKDKRCQRPFVNNLTFTGRLKTGGIENGIPTPNQKYIVDKWLQKGYGLIVAPPRTGKSILGTYISCALKARTLIITHQEGLLHNFYKAYEEMTNLPELRKQTGKEIVKIIDSVDEITDDLDVVLITYQKFIRKETAKERIDTLLKGKFGFFLTDEVHAGGASAFSKFLFQLDCKYRCGLSATPNRKDCVAENTKIWTERGILTVKEIYELAEKGEKVKVYSLNKETTVIELKPILEFHKVAVNEYREIKLSNGGTLRVTLDHEFL